jgi:glycosyltransferase involved in cell wall biosynthesis
MSSRGKFLATVSLSVAIITKNEEANIRRTLESVKWATEIVVVDSGSTDRTCNIAREYGAKVFVEEWKGFPRQKNSAIEKCTGDWILSLDADEEVSAELAAELQGLLSNEDAAVTEMVLNNSDSLERVELIMALEEAEVTTFSGMVGFAVPRKNHFLGRWIRYGGFYPDRKLRLIRKGYGEFEDRLVHEDVKLRGRVSLDLPPDLRSHLIHHAYPTLSGYIEHMNRYSDLGAEMVIEKKGKVGFSLINIVIRPLATFIYNYFFRLGFLDGREGLLLHLYHSVYVSWKYAKAWEISRTKK